jgi:leucyl/phenylalanyl-tRNA--protein transferase
MTGIVWLSPDEPVSFPAANKALKEPNGLLAAGGNLTPDWLLTAYAQGIFPWYSEGQPVLWWSPDPRAVLFPKEFHLARSLSKVLRQGVFETRINSDFTGVISACAAPRASQLGTWLCTPMIEAYTHLHTLGYAHSVETWRENRLVGGIYGICLGGVFFGESMFSRETDASKVALARLVAEAPAAGLALIDCQVPSPHLASLGSRCIPRSEFLALLERHCATQRTGHIFNGPAQFARSK